MNDKSTNDKLTNVINIKDALKKEPTYRFVTDMMTDVQALGNGQRRNNNTYLIMLEQTKEGIVRRKVHPLSQYLLEPKAGNKKYSPLTQRNRATLIAKFLNYVLIDNKSKFKLKNYNEIRFEHGTEFLNSLTEIKDVTKERYATDLAKFYYFLAKYDVLKYVSRADFKIKEVESRFGTREKIENPFYGIEYNNIEGKVLIHKLPSELIISFIDTVIMHTPQIALGVCFQFFGGLRLGEIISLRKSAVKVKGPDGQFGFVLNLRDRYMRDDLKHPVAGGSVKVKRRQAVFPFGGEITQKIYRMHMKNWSSQDALFLNKDGKPMADFTYRYYFNKAKDKFIERLKSSESVELRHYAVELQTAKWSTHIGRGIFSNIISNISDNILEIAQARGDKSLDSPLAYLSDSDKMAVSLFENDKDMWKELERKVKEHDGWKK